MNTNFQSAIPTHFHDASKVWIYQSSRPFSNGETAAIDNLLQQFVASWKSHGAAVKGLATVLFDQFIIVMADETAATVGGCSTDSSVRVIKEIEQQFNVQMFDRQSLAFIVKDKIQLLPLSQLNYSIENKFIDADTLYFNNTVLTKKELLEKWIVPVKESWLAKRIPATV